MQLAVPDHLRGRVMSVYTTIFAGSTPIGGPLMGGIASFFGVAVSLAIGGVLSAAVGIGAFAWMHRHGLDRKPLRAWSSEPKPAAPLGASLASASMPDGARPR
jgi:MFS family permease